MVHLRPRVRETGARQSESRPKLLRLTRACDFCHRRGLKCIPPPPGPITLDGPPATQPDCLTCVEYGQQCTRLRQPRKRGTKPRPKVQGAAEGGRVFGCAEATKRTAALAVEASPFTSRENMTALTDIYLDSIYPLYPFFCETELVNWWGKKAPFDDMSYYTSVMCMCSLSALQAHKGALFSNDQSFVPSRPMAEAFLEEAVRLTPLNYRSGRDIDLLRCYGILALIGTQTGDAELLHRYLGLYQGLAAKISFHNEKRWPANLSLCEKETRRRLFWVVYRIEVHNASVLGHPIRTPESQTFVGYPCGVHHAPLFPERNGQFENWFAGWNFTTELYRILEHAIIDFRTKRTTHTTVLWNRGTSPSWSILQQLKEMQSNLMPQFAQAAMKSSDSGSNRCGFQVANILCTIHLVKMVILACKDTGFGEACQTVQDLVDSISTVPRDYIRAFGTPLMQELVGAGYMLTSVTGHSHGLSGAEHLRLKVVILFLVDFIEGLGDCVESAANAALCLRASLSRVDQSSPQSVENEGSEQQQRRTPSSQGDGQTHDMGGDPTTEPLTDVFPSGPSEHSCLQSMSYDGDLGDGYVGMEDSWLYS